MAQTLLTFALCAGCILLGWVMRGEQRRKFIIMKLSEIKEAVKTAALQNKEAFSEIGAKIADMQKQIDDLISGVSDPEVTDAEFIADLNSLKTDAKALADIVPGTPAPPA